MTHASLFSGIGGCEVAAAMLGWENLFHCEINPFGRAVLDYWFPNSESYEDITKTNFEKWRGRVDVLTGGFHCQPFSHAGQRRGEEDDRFLWPEMLRAIQECRPTWVVGENVVGISTMVQQGDIVEVGSQTSLFGETDAFHTYQMRQGFVLDGICTDLERNGYKVQPLAIPACAIGAPHRRMRIFIIAEDTMRVGCEGEVAIGQHTSFLGNIGATSRDGKTQSLIASIAPMDHWKAFPTVSPIHRGNDGIPFDVDGLAIPFNKWRQEALKAYGNAIVPQVMYEIFKAIEQIEHEDNRTA